MSHKHCKVNDRVPCCTTCCNIFQASKKYATRQWPTTLRFVPDHFKTPDMCSKAVLMNPWTLKYVPDHLKTQEMCDEVVAHNLSNLRFVPDHFKMQEMCDDAALMDRGMIFITYDEVLLRLPSVLFSLISDHLKTQEMCEKTVEKSVWALDSVFDCLLAQEMFDIAVDMEPSMVVENYS